MLYAGIIPGYLLVMGERVTQLEIGVHRVVAPDILDENHNLVVTIESASVYHPGEFVDLVVIPDSMQQPAEQALGGMRFCLPIPDP